MQIDLGSNKNVAGIKIQDREACRVSTVCEPQYVKSFKVKVWTDGETVDDATGVENDKTFYASYDANSVRKEDTIKFSAAVTARYVRIYPQTWNNFLSMRAGVVLYGNQC